MITARRNAASRLLALEREDARLHERMHRARLRRNLIQEEILRLRVGLTVEQRARYEAERWMSSREEGARGD